MVRVRYDRGNVNQPGWFAVHVSMPGAEEQLGNGKLLGGCWSCIETLVGRGIICGGHLLESDPL